jgi:CubicO group peptidase (beta-lactamase class C family)
MRNTMKKSTLLPFLLLLLFNFSCFNKKKQNNIPTTKDEIDIYLKKAMKLHNIPGLALAVIKDDKIVYENYFGISSLEKNL